MTRTSRVKLPTLGEEEPRRMSCPAYNAASLWERNGHVSELENNSNRKENRSLLDLPTCSREPNAGKNKRHSWQHRIYRFRTEIDRIYSKFKLAKSHLMGGYETLKARMSPSRDPGTSHGTRNLTVEYVTRHNRKQRFCDDLLGDDSDSYDEPYHNFNSSLDIHPLKEGKFSAEILLESFPTDDDIIVRIHCYKLEVLLQKRPISRKESQHHVCRPYRCGAIDIPIYVDPATLEFTIIDDTVLLIEGDTKRAIPHRLSYSSDNILSYKTGNNHSSPKTPVLRKKGRGRSNATWYQDGDNRPYRSRSNTR